MTARKLAEAPARGVPSFQQPEILKEADLSDTNLARWRAELLDPVSWGEVLSQYGRASRLAVALTDTNGHLLGLCHNAQPLWSLVCGSAGRPCTPCPFCLFPESPCTAVAEALATSETVYVTDHAGLAHAAIPLLLGKQRLGALLAGQVLTQYPQPLALQRLARRAAVSQQQAWNLAVHQAPLSHAALRRYAEVLASLGRAFLRQRYSSVLDRELHQTNERYRLMIEGSVDHALFTVDPGGRVTSWNPGAERLLGYTESEVGGMDYSKFFIPEDIRKEIPTREIQNVEQTGWSEQEGWQVRKDGSRFLSATVTARLGEGDALEYGRLLHDVTAERAAVEAALQAQKLESVGVLAGGIAHDFNNLLTSILGNVSLAMVGLPADHATRRFLDIAERSSLKAAALIAQLLAYAGKGNFVITQFDLSHLITDVLPLIQTSISSSVQMDLRLLPDLPWIMADATEVQQIVMNLVINGAEATGEKGGIVEVSTGVASLELSEDNPPDGVYLEVRDFGCGMDVATKRKIFDPFFTTKFSGRGLGLAAVSGIVRRLKGRLEVESAPGKGSRFRIVFPGVMQGKAEPALALKLDPYGSGLILLVEDEPQVRDLTQSILEQFGYTMLIAANGRAGVDLFRSNADRLAAVFMDLTMPVMGGREAFDLMTAIRPDIPIVISSGYCEAEVLEQFGAALAGVVQKPYTVADLGEKMASVMARRKASKISTAGASGN